MSTMIPGFTYHFILPRTLSYERFNKHYPNFAICTSTPLDDGFLVDMTDNEGRIVHLRVIGHPHCGTSASPSNPGITTVTLDFA